MPHYDEARGLLAAELNGPAGVIADTVHAAASKVTPVDADEVPLVDSASSFSLKKLTWANLKAAIATYLSNAAFAIGVTTRSSGAFTTLTATSGGAFTGTFAPASGSHLELKHGGATGEIYSYDRTASAWRALNLNASNIKLLVSNVQIVDVTSTGITVSGSIAPATYTVATRPAHAAGKIIFVSDGGAGAVFQGSTGAAWVNLG